MEEQLQVKGSDILKWLKAAAAFLAGHRVAVLLIAVLVLQLIPNWGFLPWGGVWMRMQTKGMIHAYDLAGKDVSNELLEKVEQNIAKKYPGKSASERRKLATTELRRRWDYYSQLMGDRIDKRALEYRSFFAYEQDNKMYSYIYNIDSFYFLRLARNLVEKGMYGNDFKNGREYDSQVDAPHGSPIDRKVLHPYTLAWTYKLFRLFNPNIPLMEAVAFLPVILVLASIMLAFWFGYQLVNEWAGFFSALLFGLMGNSLILTEWGNIDTDMYNLFFPLLIMNILLFGLRQKGRTQILLVALCSFVFSVYAFAWHGWWFIFYTVIGALLVKTGYELSLYIKKSSSAVKNSFIILVLLLALTGMFVTLLVRFEDFSAILASPFQYRESITSIVRFNVWPNIYTTVSELRPISLPEVIASVGGMIIFAPSLLALSVIAWKKRREPSGVVCLAIILWIIGMAYASTKGVRFILILTTPVAIGFGIAAGKAIEYVEQHRQSGIFSIAPIAWHAAVIVAAFGIIMFSNQVQATFDVLRSEEPVIHDAWTNILEAIKQSSLSDAIITSWWDFGHMFNYVADRPVTVDGASQHRTVTYWVARMFTTQNEAEAVGILRMLDCGSTNAFEVMENLTGNPVAAMSVIDELLPLGKDAAESRLKQKGIDTTLIVPYFKCNPPQAFVIVSGDMVPKSATWGHFGLWNISKALAVQLSQGKPRTEAVDALQKHLNWSSEFAGKEYDTINTMSPDDVSGYIAPTPSYNSDVGNCVNDSAGLLCANGIRFNLTSFEATGVKTNTGYSVAYPTSDGGIATKPSNQSAGIYALLIPIGNRIESTTTTSELAASMFTRLYFYRGHGLKHFKLLTWQPSMVKGAIFAYRVDWEGSNTTIIDGAFVRQKTI